MLRALLVLLVLIGYACSQNCNNSITAGWFTLKYDGQEVNVTVVSHRPEGLHPDGSKIVVQHGYSGLLSTKCHTKFDPYMYQKFHLLGKTISWTSDLSQAGCGCNGSPFFAALPAFDSNNKPTIGSAGDYACAAHKKPPCPEFDVMEANQWAIQTTAHKCTGPNGRYYPTCDAGGCHTNSNLNISQYGPGTNYTINSKLPFRTSVTFTTHSKDQDALAQVKIELTQSGKSTSWVLMDSMCHPQKKGPNYLEDFANQISSHGMGMTLCYWGSSGYSMKWLDHPPCDPSVACDANSNVTFSDLEIM